MKRRDFLITSGTLTAAAAACTSVPWIYSHLFENESPTKVWFTHSMIVQRGQVVGDTLLNTPGFVGCANIKTGQCELLDVPLFGHEVIQNPVDPSMLFTSEKWGIYAALIDFKKRKLIAKIQNEKGRRFFGHAQFSPDGKTLYVAEMNDHTHEGVIVQRDLKTGAILNEYSSGGVLPHQMHWIHGGKSLAVMNYAEGFERKHELASPENDHKRAPSNTEAGTAAAVPSHAEAIAPANSKAGTPAAVSSNTEAGAQAVDPSNSGASAQARAQSRAVPRSSQHITHESKSDTKLSSSSAIYSNGPLAGGSKLSILALDAKGGLTETEARLTAEPSLYHFDWDPAADLAFASGNFEMRRAQTEETPRRSKSALEILGPATLAATDRFTSSAIHPATPAKRFDFGRAGENGFLGEALSVAVCPGRAIALVSLPESKSILVWDWALDKIIQIERYANNARGVAFIDSETLVVTVGTEMIVYKYARGRWQESRRFPAGTGSHLTVGV